MGQKDKEAAGKGRLAPHDPDHCRCDGSYVTVSDYFKRRMLELQAFPGSQMTKYYRISGACDLG